MKIIKIDLILLHFGFLQLFEITETSFVVLSSSSMIEKEDKTHNIFKL